MFRTVTSVLLLGLAGSAQAAGYLRLDGRYYLLADGDAIELDLAAGVVAAPGAQMSDCARAGGGALPTGSLVLNYPGGQVALLGDDIQVSGVHESEIVLDLLSTGGDVVCNGEVPAPNLPDAVFASSFE